MTTPVTFASRDGLALEGAVDSPDDPAAAIVLCHPHPRMGGTMEAPLLGALATHLVDSGWAVVRFNFRGIGKSEGSSSTGEDEVADAAGALDHARSRWGDLPLAIAGWSFGAAVAIRTALEDDSLAGCVAVAPAVRRTEDVTAGLPAPAGLRLAVPVLMICGANDHLVAEADCTAWAGAVPGVEARVVGGANHFFWGKYEALAEMVASWLGDRIGERRE